MHTRPVLRPRTGAAARLEATALVPGLRDVCDEIGMASADLLRPRRDDLIPVAGPATRGLGLVYRSESTETGLFLNFGVFVFKRRERQSRVPGRGGPSVSRDKSCEPRYTSALCTRVVTV